MAISGNIVLNGITDRDLAKIWELKAKHERKFNFLPNQLQPVNQNNNANQPTGIYNNAMFSWADDQGLEIVHEVVRFILKKDEHEAKAANQ